DFGYRITEIVIGGDGVDFNALIVRAGSKLVTARGRPVQRITVRAFAVDLDAIVSVLRRPGDHLWQGERFAAIPEAQVGNAVESDLHRNGPFLLRPEV